MTTHKAGVYVHSGTRRAGCPVSITSAGGQGTVKCFACGGRMVRKQSARDVLAARRAK